jgi:hypothetical protein
MTIQEIIRKLVEETDRVLSLQKPWTEGELPNFTTIKDKGTVYFSDASWRLLKQLSVQLFENRNGAEISLDTGSYFKCVRQAFCRCYLDGHMRDADELSKSNVKALRANIDDEISGLTTELTHHLPVNLVFKAGFESFKIGPIVFLTIPDWIDSVEFHPRVANYYSKYPEENKRWKELVLDAYSGDIDGNSLNGVAREIFPAVSGCSAVARLEIKGCESRFSLNVARLAVKSALDGISLYLGDPSHFSQQTLNTERSLAPREITLFETNGNLWMPGSSLNKRPKIIEPSLVSELENAEVIHKIIRSLIDPSSDKTPELSRRWATALDWLGEGCRESSDHVAVAKLATSLDVLSSGGKFAGILDMVSHILELDPQDIVTSHASGWTLHRLVKEIYDSGRSQILHGSRYDRLEPMNELRGLAVSVAMRVIFIAGNRLVNYRGPDNYDAFRSMTDR